MVFLSLVSPVDSNSSLVSDACLLSAYGISNPSPLPTLDGVSDGLLPSSLPEILVRNVLWPSNV